jgi:hypothetical protein
MPFETKIFAKHCYLILDFEINNFFSILYIKIIFNLIYHYVVKINLSKINIKVNIFV